MQDEKQAVVDILLPMLIPLKEMSYTVWIGRVKTGLCLSLLNSVNLSPLSLSVTISSCLVVCLWHCICLSPFPLCVALCHAFLSAPAPFIGPCHWAMCAVPVSKTPGRLSSFPCWRMQGQHGSCESYRLGSVKALPVGKLFPPAF